MNANRPNIFDYINCENLVKDRVLIYDFITNENIFINKDTKNLLVHILLKEKRISPFSRLKIELLLDEYPVIQTMKMRWV